MPHLFRPHDRIKTACRLLPLIGLLPSVAPAAWGQAAPITQHNDNLRTGANLGETLLTTANVRPATFGKLFNIPVDGTVFAQPLYAPRVAIAGGIHNVLYVATAHDSVYACDADTGALLAGPVSLGTPVPLSSLFPEDGIIGTPVIDPNTGTLYVVAKTSIAATGVQNFYLHALSWSTLQDKSPSVLITAQSAGVGYGPNNPLDNNGQTVFFYPTLQVQRPALTLASAGGRSVVYVAFGSLDDINPYHGWVLGYDAASLAQVSVFNDTPNGGEGGIWMSGQGLVADPAGSLYLTTGNSSQSTENAVADYGESFLKLTPGGGTLGVTDYFKVFNYDSLNAIDGDLGSGGLVGIPGTSCIVGGGKQGTFYLVDTNNMGKLSTTGTDNVLQVWQANNGLLGSPVFWNSATPTLYVWSGNDQLRAYPFSVATHRFATTPGSVSAFYTPPGESSTGVLAVSSNGSTPGTGIVWATVPASDPGRTSAPGTLYAYDAADLGNPLWNSSQNPASDAYGGYAKFCAPTVAGGRVFVATNSGQVCVYGLLVFQAPTGLAATSGVTSASLTWAAPTGAAPSVTYNVYRGTAPRLEAAVPVATGVTGTAYTDTGLTTGTRYYYKVTAVGAAGEGAQSNEAISVPNAAGTVDYQVDAGGSGTPPFVADAYYGSPTSTANTDVAVRVSGVPNAAPAAVYQTVRFAPSGDLGYTFKGLTPRAAYVVRLHDAENWVSPDGPRLFSLAINGTTVLTDFNISAAAGGANIAVVRNFNTVADTNGNIYVRGFHGSASDPMFGGLEVLDGSVTAAPSGLTAAGGSAQVALAWSAVSGATGYDLYRSTAPGGEGSVPVVTGLTGAAFTDTGLVPGISYYYLVSAVNAGGESARSGEAVGTPSAPLPAAPSALTAAGGNAQVALSWSAVSGATGYNLYRSAAPGKEALSKSGLTGTAYTDTGLTNGTAYYYTVAAVNAAGVGAPSKEASTTPLSPVPAAPVGLSGTRSLSQTVLKWNAVSGATTYNLYRGTAGGGETLYATGLTTTTASLSAFFTPAYYYQVTAVNARGESARSNEVRY